MGALFHVADEKDGVSIRRPEFIAELPVHQVSPVFSLAYLPPKSLDFPVNDGLGVTVAIGALAPILIAESPWGMLVRVFRLVGVVE